jgi:hypothetical protein
MPATRKNTTKRSLRKRKQAVVVVIESKIAAKDTLFPEKVAKGNKMLRRTKFHPSLGL